MKGSYVLLIELSAEKTITVGSLRTVHFPRGSYAYVGSAMGGFKSRLNRHLSGNKRPRWHIDYLLKLASLSGVILVTTEERAECAIAQALSRQFNSIPGFGSSDCNCPSHLFFAPNKRRMKAKIMSSITSLGMMPISDSFLPHGKITYGLGAGQHQERQ